MAKECIVLGAGVGGLSAAIHARLYGFDVHVLERQSVAGGKAAAFTSHGFTFDPGPSIIILPEIYEQLFNAAGRSMSDYLTFDRLDPISSVFFRDQVLDLSANLDRCIGQIGEIDPMAKRFVERMIQDFDRISGAIYEAVFSEGITGWPSLVKPAFLKIGTSLMAKGSYKEHVDHAFASPLLRAFFYGFPSYSGLSYSTKTLSPMLIPYFMLRSGVYYPRGGVGAIPKALERLARELGVHFTMECEISALSECKDGLRLSTSKGEFSTPVVISNIDRLSLQKLFGKEPAATPSYSYFTIQWGLRKKFANLKHHTLLVPDEPERSFHQLYDRNEFPGEPVVYLNATSETDPSVAPPECTNLFVVVSSPSQVATCDWTRITDAAKERTISLLARYGFAPNARDIEFERIQTPLTFEERDGSYRGSLYGPIEKERFMGGMFPLTNRDERIKNLFYCGGSVQPGAGLPMVTLSGKFAARLAAKSQNRF